MEEKQEKTNPFIPTLTITNKRFRYADLVLYGKKRRLTHPNGGAAQ